MIRKNLWRGSLFSIIRSFAYCKPVHFQCEQTSSSLLSRENRVMPSVISMTWLRRRTMEEEILTNTIRIEALKWNIVEDAQVKWASKTERTRGSNPRIVGHVVGRRQPAVASLHTTPDRVRSFVVLCHFSFQDQGFWPFPPSSRSEPEQLWDMSLSLDSCLRRVIQRANSALSVQVHKLGAGKYL